MPANPRNPPPMSHEERVAQRLGDQERAGRTLGTSVNGGISQLPVVDTLPAAGRAGRILYRSDGTVWVDIATSWKQVTLT